VLRQFSCCTLLAVSGLPPIHPERWCAIAVPPHYDKYLPGGVHVGDT
jgi:hypothetical protein